MNKKKKSANLAFSSSRWGNWLSLLSILILAFELSFKHFFLGIKYNVSNKSGLELDFVIINVIFAQ